MNASGSSYHQARMPARRMTGGQLPAYLLDESLVTRRCLPKLQRIKGTPKPMALSVALLELVGPFLPLHAMKRWLQGTAKCFIPRSIAIVDIVLPSLPETQSAVRNRTSAVSNRSHVASPMHNPDWTRSNLG